MKKKLVSVLLVTAMALSVALAGCSGANGAAAPAADGTGAAGTVLNVQVGPSPETIDPALNSSVDGANMIIHAFEGLLKFDKNNDVVAGLAESYEVSDDGITWTFNLRDGLKWSDGSDLTADDFVYSWKRVADPMTAAPYGYDLLTCCRRKRVTRRMWNGWH